RSKTRCLYELTEVLAKRHQARHMSALVIDEAPCLPDVLLEETRLLANIESASEKLLSIILAGQPELADRLNQTSLRQLKQRVGLRCALRPLRHDETTAYIAARIGVAGGKTERIFTREAIDTVHECAGGIPRTISVICDNALVTAFALDRRPVDTDVVLEVCRDFDFMPEGASYDKTGWRARARQFASGGPGAGAPGRPGGSRAAGARTFTGAGAGAGERHARKRSAADRRPRAAGHLAPLHT